jgi:hypothetical protein
MTALKTKVMMEDTLVFKNVIDTANVEEYCLEESLLCITIYFVSGRIRRYTFKIKEDYINICNKLIGETK